jgi:hypothetical protein
VGGKYQDAHPLRSVAIMGVQGSVADVKFNGRSLSSGTWTLNGTSKVLDVDLQAVTGLGAWKAEWTLTWA